MTHTRRVGLVARSLVVGALAAGAATACSTAPQTGFLVELSSQVPVERVVVRVFHSTGELAQCIEKNVDPVDHSPLPLTLGLEPSDPSAEGLDVRVMVLGYLDGSNGHCEDTDFGSADIRAEALVRYVPRELLALPMPFSLSCLGTKCEGDTTCRFGSCEPLRVDVSRLSSVAEGIVLGRGCYDLGACRSAVELSRNDKTTCFYAVPRSVLESAPNGFVPYVVYGVGEGEPPASEFLSSNDFQLVGDGSSFELLPPLCKRVQSGTIQSVGVASPCGAIEGRPVCQSAVPEAKRLVALGETSRPDAGPVDASKLDSSAVDSSSPGDANLDGNRADSTLSDGGNDGAISDATAEAAADSASDSAGDASDGANDAGQDSANDAGQDSATGGDGGRPTNNCLTGSDCCGLCSNVNGVPTCFEVLGPSYGPTGLASNVTMTSGSIYWLSGDTNASFINRVDPGFSQIVEQLQTEGTGAYGIVAVGEGALVVGRVSNSGAVATLDAYDLTQWRSTGPNTLVTGVGNHKLFMSTDGQSVFLLRLSDATSMASNVVVKYPIAGTTFGAPVAAPFTNKMATVLDMAAGNDAVAVLVRSMTGSYHVGTADFVLGAVTAVDDTDPGSEFGTPIGGLSARRDGIRGFFFTQPNVMLVTSALYAQDIGGTPMIVPVDFLSGSATQTAPSAPPGTGFIVYDAVTRKVDNFWDFSMQPTNLAQGGFNGSALRTSNRCAVWEEDDGHGGRQIHAARISP